jgi:hypothetical protein
MINEIIDKHNLKEFKEPLWVHGLRSERNDPGSKNEEWEEVVTKMILGNLEGVISEASKNEAEMGFGISPSFYWFISRTDEAYGGGIFFDFVDPEICEGINGGVCPFDTGGLWKGYIKTNPPLDNDAKRRDFFLKNDTPIHLWAKTFRDYINENYSRFVDYVDGKAPKKGIPGIRDDGFNKPRAWTWEGRMVLNMVEEKRKKVLFLGTKGQQIGFEDWIKKRKNISLEDKLLLKKWIKKNFNLSEGDESPVFVGAEILRTLGIKDEK